MADALATCTGSSGTRGAASGVTQAGRDGGVVLTPSVFAFQVPPEVVLGSAGCWEKKDLFAPRIEQLL